MNKILIVIVIVSLFFIEGCTVIGYSIGKGIQTKEELEIEEIQSIEINSWLSISLKNSEVIKGQLISCINDTLLVTFQTNKNLNATISNNQFLSISKDKAFYKIPIDQITDIKIRKADKRVVGALVGLIIDIISYQVLKMVFMHNFKLPNFFK